MASSSSDVNAVSQDCRPLLLPARPCGLGIGRTDIIGKHAHTGNIAALIHKGRLLRPVVCWRWGPFPLKRPTSNHCMYTITLKPVKRLLTQSCWIIFLWLQGSWIFSIHSWLPLQVMTFALAVMGSARHQVGPRAAQSLGWCCVPILWAGAVLCWTNMRAASGCGLGWARMQTCQCIQHCCFITQH